MLKKKILKRKSKSLKKTSLGMIDKAVLKDKLLREQWKVQKRRSALTNAKIEIEELKEQLDHPDYYGDGYHDSPTFAGQREEAQLKSDSADKLIHEIDSIAAFYIGFVTCMSAVATLGLIILLMSVA